MCRSCRGWRDGLVVNSTTLCSRGPEIDSQHPPNWQRSLTPALGIWRHLLASTALHTCGTHPLLFPVSNLEISSYQCVKASFLKRNFFLLHGYTIIYLAVCRKTCRFTLFSTFYHYKLYCTKFTLLAAVCTGVVCRDDKSPESWLDHRLCICSFDRCWQIVT